MTSVVSHLYCHIYVPRTEENTQEKHHYIYIYVYVNHKMQY